MIKSRQEMLHEVNVLIESIRSQQYISEKSLQDEIEELSFVKNIFVEDNGIGWDVTTIFMHDIQYPVLARAKGEPQSLALGLRYLRDYIKSGQYEMQVGVDKTSKKKGRVATATLLALLFAIILLVGVLTREKNIVPIPMTIATPTTVLVEEGYAVLGMTGNPARASESGLCYPEDEYVRPSGLTETQLLLSSKGYDQLILGKRYNSAEWACYQGKNENGSLVVACYGQPYADGNPSSSKEMRRFEGATMIVDMSGCQ